MNGTTSSVPSYRLIAAGLILLVYFGISGVILASLLGNTPLKNWDQIIVIFNAVGALATTACGVLLGVEVQQANVDAARGESQSLSRQVGRKDAAALEALGHLEATNPAARGADPLAGARSALQRGLAAGDAVTA
jgi:hypothetical protein